MTQIINGKLIAKAIHTKTADLVSNLPIKPHLHIVLIGNDSASNLYIKKKAQAANKVGIKVTQHQFSSDITFSELQKNIIKIQSSKDITGIIVQLPVPENFYPHILDVINPEFDVDCLTHTNLGKIVMQTNNIVPPTPGAVLEILKNLNIDLSGKNITIVGTGVLVGKPLSIMLMNLGATVTTCNIHTKDLAQKTLGADIVISGVGKKHIIDERHISPETIVIDAGVNFENNQMFGDVNFEKIKNIAKAATPTPGGVGPITVAKLLNNTATLAAQKQQKK